MAIEIHVVEVLLLTLLVLTAVAVVRQRGLWAAVMLMGIYSFLGAGWMLILDAPDVALTEASVGAGISTILALATLALTKVEAKKPVHSPFIPLVVVTVTGAALIYGTLDMPLFGDPNAPAQVYPDPSYIERTREDIKVPNVVTAVLASYRGYDTLGEATVVLTAGIGVLLLLRGSRTRRRNGRGET
jgi:multicomponent Na+:H+ antiporter subunit B